MKCMKRNLQKAYYALFTGFEPILDEEGYSTGEKRITYSVPHLFKANISAAKGSTDIDHFGITEQYDRIVIPERDCPLTEASVLWIDCCPEVKEDGTTDTPHDYVVVRIAKSLNHMVVAVKKVAVNR